MGFFSHYITAVSSSAYNLAGDYASRVNYTEAAVLNAVIDADASVGETVRKAYLNGPATRLRSYHSWASKNAYAELLGVATTSLSSGSSIDTSSVLPAIGITGGSVVFAKIDSADISFWADQFMWENYPKLVDTAWTFALVGDSVLITFADATTTTFKPADYHTLGRYLYVSYTLNGAAHLFIYRRNGGNAVLDAMFGADTDGVGEFLMPVPVRLNNKFVSADYLPEVYSASKRALHRAMGSVTVFDDLVDKLKDNANLGDIDYAYVVFGAALNSKDKSSLRYVYEFFQNIIQENSLKGDEYVTWLAAYEAAVVSRKAYDEWVSLASKPPNSVAPQVLPYPAMPSSSFSMTSTSNSVMNVGFKMDWSAIAETSGTGLKSSKHSAGDLWWEVDSAESFPIVLGTHEITTYSPYGQAATHELQKVVLHWQVNDNEWRAIGIWNLRHINEIYDEKSVVIFAADALADEDESGFIVPLHAGIMRGMGAAAAHQFALSASYMVVNCYTTVKKKWYQTGLFQVVITIIMIVLTVLVSIGTFGTGTAPMVSALASYLGCSAAVAATIIAIASYVAVMLITQILTSAAKALFGERVGSIVGPILACLVAIAAGSYANNVSFITYMSSATNLMAMTTAVITGVSGYLTTEAQLKGVETQGYLGEVEKQMDNINDLYSELITSSSTIDPMHMMTASEAVNTLRSVETPSVFLSRTLMTGSDIAQATIDLIDDFTDLTLRPNLYI